MDTTTPVVTVTLAQAIGSAAAVGLLPEYLFPDYDEAMLRNEQGRLTKVICLGGHFDDTAQAVAFMANLLSRLAEGDAEKLVLAMTDNPLRIASIGREYAACFWPTIRVAD